MDLLNPGASDGKGNVCAPMLVHALKDTKVVCVAAGGATSAAVTESGELWMWGDGSWGQCGQGSLAFSQAPARVMGFLEDVKVAQVRFTCVELCKNCIPFQRVAHPLACLH